MDMRSLLKALMALRDENAYALEERSGVPQATINRFLTGKHGDPRSTTVRKWAGAYNLTESQLRGDAPLPDALMREIVRAAPGHADDLLPSTNCESTMHPAMPEQASVGPAPERSGRVPLISWVQAGDWSHAADLLHPGEAVEWIDTSVTVRPHTFALRVEGDSMEPEFAPGTILVVEPEMDAYPGDYVIAKNGDDEATFKQLVRDGADLYLKPLNARYPIKPLGNSRIVGVVREAVKRYR